MAKDEASPPPPPPLHVVILPWLAFGHMIPFFNLSISLATAGLRISFLSTPRNIARLPKIPTNLTPLFHFVDFPLPPVNGLPPNAEATVDLSSDQQPYLKIAYDMLQHPIKHFLLHLQQQQQQQQDQPPLCIVHDFIPYWIIDIGHACNNIPCIYFSVYSAAVFTFFVGPPNTEPHRPYHHHQWSPKSLTEKPEWVPFPSIVAFRLREAELIHRSALTVDESGVSGMDRMRVTVKGCNAIAVRSCSESVFLEGEYLELFQRLYDPKPVMPTGVLLPPVLLPTSSSSEPKQGGWERIFKWLDTQNQKSVVFVSFGSEYKLSESEIVELASGLELSDIPFLWALRSKPASWASEEEQEGFVSRGAHGQGIVVFGWAPQMEILAHPSIGGSLFHSGWGSIIETLRYGHVLIVLPSIFDQGLNARLVVEKGLGLEVERGEDGSLNRDVIARCLITAMVSIEGEGMRVKAREMGVVLADQAFQHLYVKGFIDYLLKVSTVT